MGFNCGIVGLPNVGKSTLFNALTSTAAAEAANYPFCTIEPNVGRVSVPDERLTTLAAIAGSKAIIPTQLEFVDIAGLVKGASKGEGLGNQFLGHIREVDAIIQVLRCFEDGDVTHVEGTVDPLRDADIVETELIFADLDSIERRLPNLQKKAKSGDKESNEILPILEAVKQVLEQGKPARTVKLDPNQVKHFKQLQLLTAKPLVYVCNVAEHEVQTGNVHSEKVKQKAAAEKASAVIISAKIEAEISALQDEAEKQEFLSSLGLSETGLSQIIREGYAVLNLNTFFTIGPKEAHAWTVLKGAVAPQAAGAIHTDFEKGFIRAETISYHDFVSCKGEQGAKESGKMRLEGKEYLVQDGDIFHFRFNV
ncbi:MAG: redox-regulated ATPase YchF [Alphaproteobacteria bacterium]|nr:redox-regulated ATPase YchF [Alphaproteobacteria bacterium]